MMRTKSSCLQTAALAFAMLSLVLVRLDAGAQQDAKPATRSAAASESNVPDFSGVWRTINPPAAPRTNTTLRWRPGPGDLPPFNAEYQAKYEKIQASRESGSEETESVARCLPPGMPWFTLAQYGLEIVQARDKIAFFSEWMDAYRRVYLDGRKMPKDLDPSYNGYSTGHWEGDTLVVETVNLRDDTNLDRYGSPHSDAMTITERFRLTAPDVLEDKLTVRDPKAFTKPWEVSHSYRRAKPDNDELHENTCTEGLKLAK
jgi:hypothetical protein